jgi:SAM-dependent methyltransferase
MKLKLRDVGNILLDRSTRVALSARKGLQLGLGLTHNYHPDPFDPRPTYDPRDCRGRYLAAESMLGDLPRPSVLDIGCHQGYFTFRFAEKGGICLGVDNDRAELMVARARAEEKKIRNIAFLELTLDQENIQGLPISDIVVCMSLFHHWVRYYGKEGAEKTLALLAGKAGKAIVFDSGQPEESSTSWGNLLTFMQPTGPEWISQQLKSLGFVSVHEVGYFSTSLSPVQRALFVARRA